MYVDGAKIRKLIAVWGNNKGYPEKSYVTMFCNENNLSYNQWNAYLRGSQNLGTKIIQQLISIFPDLNLNWLLKEDLNMFTKQNVNNHIEEPEPKYKNVTNDDIMAKLEEVHADLRKKLSI